MKAPCKSPLRVLEQLTISRIKSTHKVLEIATWAQIWTCRLNTRYIQEIQIFAMLYLISYAFPSPSKKICPGMMDEALGKNSKPIRKQIPHDDLISTLRRIYCFLESNFQSGYRLMLCPGEFVELRVVVLVRAQCNMKDVSRIHQVSSLPKG